MASWPWNGEWPPVVMQCSTRRDTSCQSTPKYTRVTGCALLAQVINTPLQTQDEDPTLTDDKDETKRKWKEAKKSNRQLVAGELQLREETCMKLSLSKSRKRPQRRGNERKKEDQQGRGSSAVGQVLRPPGPFIASCFPAHPALPIPPPWPRRLSTWARDGGGDDEETQHKRMEAELLT